jgi:hypothetical protein
MVLTTLEHTVLQLGRECGKSKRATGQQQGKGGAAHDVDGLLHARAVEWREAINAGNDRIG